MVRSTACPRQGSLANVFIPLFNVCVCVCVANFVFSIVLFSELEVHNNNHHNEMQAKKNKNCIFFFFCSYSVRWLMQYTSPCGINLCDLSEKKGLRRFFFVLMLFSIDERIKNSRMKSQWSDQKENRFPFLFLWLFLFRVFHACFFWR